jgi:hypothetical protein
MFEIFHGLGVILVVVGIYTAGGRPTGPAQTGTKVSMSKAIPVPVCPPNDPNACHIDKW